MFSQVCNKLQNKYVFFQLKLFILVNVLGVYSDKTLTAIYII